jgi:hypothetical protein
MLSNWMPLGQAAALMLAVKIGAELAAPMPMIGGLTYHGPSVAQAVTLGPRVIWVKHVLMRASDPCPPGNFRDDRRQIADLSHTRNLAMKL